MRSLCEAAVIDCKRGPAFRLVHLMSIGWKVGLFFIGTTEIITGYLPSTDIEDSIGGLRWCGRIQLAYRAEWPAATDSRISWIESERNTHQTRCFFRRCRSKHIVWRPAQGIGCAA